MGNTCFGKAPEWDAPSGSLPRGFSAGRTPSDFDFLEYEYTPEEQEFMAMSMSNKLANAFVGKNAGTRGSPDSTLGYGWSSNDSEAPTEKRQAGDGEDTISLTSSAASSLASKTSTTLGVLAAKKKRAVAWMKGSSLDGVKFTRGTSAE
mmetsp:Transcript_28317/g.70098  ORF Transcript_28317/g.70098 Transcript_28317/m.70098 type:complete len:149 (-) Transcript_28317:325-771(-)